jgi:aspartokinase
MHTGQQNLIKVVKFGGSSLGSASGFQGSARVIKSHLDSGSQVVVVASAIYGVTNKLIAVANAAEKRDFHLIEAIRSSILLLHHNALQVSRISCTFDAFHDPIGYAPQSTDEKHGREGADRSPRTPSALNTLQELVQIFDGLLDFQVNAVASAGRCEAKYMDAISSIGMSVEATTFAIRSSRFSRNEGERLSTKLLAAYLTDHGIPAFEMPTDDLLMTTGDHGAALPLLDATAARARPAILAALENSEVFGDHNASMRFHGRQADYDGLSWNRA